MRQSINLKKELEFNNNIAEITSISLECNYEVDAEKATGVFLIEGSYRSHEVSLNQENFSYKVPFEYLYDAPVEESSVVVNVKDFTYTVDSNQLCVDIEYEVLGEITQLEEDFIEKEEFDRFLEEHEVEVVDLREDEEDALTDKEDIEENSIEEESVEEKNIEQFLEEVEEDRALEDVKSVQEEIPVTITPEEEIEDTSREIANSVIDNLSGENTFITYHVYVCSETDTLDSISNKFKITTDIIKNYNSIDNISFGTKLIIPTTDE